LFSAKGYTLNQLADIFDLDRDTVSEWLRVWEQQGTTALCDAPKPGRPPKLDEATREELVRTVREAPSSTLKTRLLENLKKRRERGLGDSHKSH
jgi:transposase